MTDRERIKTLLKASPNGTITTQQVTSAGLHRSILQKLVDSGEIYRFGRGLYVRNDAWEDDFFLLQLKYGRGIYSHDTALYLHGYIRGGCSPIGMKKKFPTYIEETAQLYDTIMVSAGQRGVQVTVSPEYLREYVDGIFVGLV